MIEKRLKCPICDYLMRVLDETDEGYLCYCVKCDKERYVDKYSFKQFLIDIERGKEIEENLLIDLFQRQESKIEKLNNENEQLRQQIGELQYSKKMLRSTNKDLELGICNLRKSFEELDNMRIKHIKFLQKRMKKHGISIYCNDDGDVE